MDYKIELESTNAYEEILSLLKQDGYVNEDNTVNVVNLVDEELDTGKGSIENGDIYVLEQREIIATTVETDQTSNLPYYLIYYNANKEEKILGKAFDVSGEDFQEATPEEYFEFDAETSGIALKDSNSYYFSANVEERTLGLDTIIVPSTYQGQTVKRLGIRYYNDYKGSSEYNVMGINVSDVKEIILPDTIIEIDSPTRDNSGAFQKCTSLEEINLPNSLESIGGLAFKDCTALKTIIIPDSVIEMSEYVFQGWNSDQTILIEHRTIPDTWNPNWYKGCDAKVVLGYDPDYSLFAQEYLLNKNQEELEELILKTEGYPGTFDQFLIEVGMTREEWEQQGANKGMTYMEYLKDLLIYGDNGFSWVQVEFEVSKQGGTGKTVEELETLYAQKYGAESLDELLAKGNMTKEQFLEKLKKQGFRTEEDFLKVYVYFVPDV